MRSSAWHPPVELSCVEQTIIQRIKCAKLFVFLRYHRHEVFDDAFQEELATLYASGSRGQPPIALAQLALATILQAYTGIFDDEVIEVTLMDRRLIERTIELANSTQEFGPRALRAALDSSPLWGAGRVEDTHNLIGHALKKALRLVAKQRGEAVGDVGHETGAEIVCSSSLKAALDQEWDQIEQREEELNLVVQVLHAVEAWVQTLEHEEKELAQPVVETAKLVQEQNVQLDENNKARMIKGVAKDRRISIEDTEMRHGRKSRNVRVDGYKRHVLHDLDSGLIRAVGIAPANIPEANVTPKISIDLEQQGVRIKELHIDRGYLSSQLVRERSEGMEIYCKAWACS